MINQMFLLQRSKKVTGREKKKTILRNPGHKRTEGLNLNNKRPMFKLGLICLLAANLI